MATYGRPTPGMTRLMGTNGAGKAIAPVSSQLRPPPQGFTQGDVIQHRVNPGMSRVQRNGRYLPIDEAMGLGPLQHQGWNTRMGQDDGRRIGSAAGALGSGGTPTSQRGRFDRIMREGGSPEEAVDSAMTPSWVVAEQARNNVGTSGFGGGLSQSQNYGTMGAPLLRTRPTGGAADWAGNSARGGNISFYADGTKDSGPKPKVAVVGERGPEVVVVPPRSAVIPNEMTALGDLVGDLSPEPTGPGNGEIRTDAQGNQWRYDAKQGRGIPVNPYILGNENAPSPNAFRASPSERYNDLTSRLNALRQAGMAEGRAAVDRVKAEQNAETARRDAFLATGNKVADADGGGTLYKTKYGTAIVGGNRPKSFTVENFEGGQTTSPDLAAVDKESRTDAAERSVRGLATNAYRASPTAITQANPYVAPTALEDITGVAEVAPEDVGTDSEDENILEVPQVSASDPRVRRAQTLANFLQNRSRGAEVARPSSVAAAPRGAQPSRVGQFLRESGSRIGDALSTIPSAAVDAWDYLLKEGGTKREREARAGLAGQEKRLEDRGFKITKDKYGNWTDISGGPRNKNFKP